MSRLPSSGFCHPTEASASEAYRALQAAVLLWLIFGALLADTLRAQESGAKASHALRTGFQRLTPTETGLLFTNAIPTARHLTNQMLLDGSGVALADVDADGRVDIFFAGANGGSQLWHNDGGWKFSNRTAASLSGVADYLAGDVTGVAAADLNGDGSPDLVLNSHAAGIAVLTNSAGVFRRLQFSQSTARGGHSVALADVDGDGWVDIYVCNYRQRALMDMPSARATFRKVDGVQTVATLNGRPTTDPELTNRFVVNAAGGIDELGEPDVLYRNLGGTNFVEVPWGSGVFLDEDGQPLAEPPRDWALAAQFCDVNNDGRPDLYVCNDFQSPDRLWLNESEPGKIHLRLVPRSAIRRTSLFSMGVDFADINRDGRWDLAVLDMLSPDHVRRLTMLDGTPTVLVNRYDPRARLQQDANTLLVQRADGSFTEIAAFAGVSATDWSWTPAFMDVDLDGWPDLLVSAGQERGSRDLDVAEHMKSFRKAGMRTDAQIFRERLKFPGQPCPIRGFRNRGVASANGIPVFEDSGRDWGLDFVGVTHGMALADLDGDGDLDVVANALNAPAVVYRNVSESARLWVHLKGAPPNTTAVGARLRFVWRRDDQPETPELPQMVQVTGGGRYLSGDDAGRTFACPGRGLGSLEIRWPSGRVEWKTNLVAGRGYQFDEPMDGRAASPRGDGSDAPGSGFRFEAMPSAVVTSSSSYPDFDRQPLLPRRQSTGSPGLAMASQDGKGAVVWITGGPGQPLRRAQVSREGLTDVRDVGGSLPAVAAVAWGTELLVADDAWNGGGGTGSHVHRVNAETGERRSISSAIAAPTGLAVSAAAPTPGAWLFVAGGSIPGRFPEASPSEFLRYESGDWKPVGTLAAGIVRAAAWGNVEGDGEPQLVTVSEWGVPRVIRWKDSRPEIREFAVVMPDGSRVGLASLSGWWQSLALEDVDGDGKLDCLLGNWGLNSGYSLLGGVPVKPDGGIRPLGLLHGPALEAGPGGCVETYTGDDGRIRPIHGLLELARHVPWMATQFPTHRSFADATMDTILGDRRTAVSRLECRWLASMLLLRRGDHFEARLLPDPVQLGPVTAWAAGDFDGDGRVDLYAAQGFFGANFGLQRDDAGEGVLLFNRGGGRFEAHAIADLGAHLPGEQRSVVATDVDKDGRLDLVIGVHGGPVTILRNRRP